MSSSPSELVDCALSLLGDARSEPQYRTVCSRAYYGAFHAANLFHNALPTPGTVGAARGRHEQLIAQLANPTCSKRNHKYFVSQALSKVLRTLINARVRADYLIDTEVDFGMAAKSSESARVVMLKTSEFAVN